LVMVFELLGEAILFGNGQQTTEITQIIIARAFKKLKDIVPVVSVKKSI